MLYFRAVALAKIMIFDLRRVCSSPCITEMFMANKRARKNTKEAHRTEGSTPHMTKTKKAKSRNRRRRPSIRHTQAADLVRALTPSRTRRRAEFDAAHKEGMDALIRHDSAALQAAVIHERKVIDFVSAAIQRARTRRK